ncbi:MAG: polymer-forming cytoskeletal protein [bacterium]|nr:polymer-forming cytoskeletal protein [bacterium]
MNTNRKFMLGLVLVLAIGTLVLMLAAATLLAQKDTMVIKTKLLDKSTAIKVQGLSEPAPKAGETYKLKMAGKDIEINAKDTRVGDVHIAAGDTIDDDLATKGGSITVDGVVTGDCAAMGGSVFVNGEVQGDVACFGGSADVAGTVGGGLACFGGSANITGSVGEELACFGGTVTLGPKSSVGGDISVMGGTVEKSDSAQIGGEIQKLDLGMLNNMLPGMIGHARVVHEHPVKSRFLVFGIWFFVALGFSLIILLITALFPHHIEAVKNATVQDTWKSFGIGLLVIVAFMPVWIMLLITIVGIFVVPLAYAAALLVSLAVFGMILGQRFFQVTNKPQPGTVLTSMTGFLLLMAVMVAGMLINVAGSPFNILGWILVIISWIACWIGISLGLGGVWLSRFGTVKTYRSPALPPAVPETKPQ